MEPISPYSHHSSPTATFPDETSGSEKGSKSTVSSDSEQVDAFQTRRKCHKKVKSKKTIMPQREKLEKKRQSSQKQRLETSTFFEKLHAEISPNTQQPSQLEILEKCLSFIAEYRASTTQSASDRITSPTENVEAKKAVPPTTLKGNERHQWWVNKRRQSTNEAFSKLQRLVFPDTRSKVTTKQILQQSLTTIREYKKLRVSTQIPVDQSASNPLKTPQKRRLSDQTSSQYPARKWSKHDSSIPGESTEPSNNQHQHPKSNTSAPDQTSAKSSIESSTVQLCTESQYPQQKDDHEAGCMLSSSIDRSEQEKSDDPNPVALDHSAVQKSNSDIPEIIEKEEPERNLTDLIAESFDILDSDQTDENQLQQLLAIVLQQASAIKSPPPIEIDTEISETENADIYQSSSPRPGCSHWDTQIQISTQSPPLSSNTITEENNSEETSLKSQLSTLTQILEIPDADASEQENVTFKRCIRAIKDLQSEKKILENKVEKYQEMRYSGLTMSHFKANTAKNKENIKIVNEIEQSRGEQKNLLCQIDLRTGLLKISIDMLKTLLNHPINPPVEYTSTTDVIKDYRNTLSTTLKSINRDVSIIKTLSDKITMLQEKIHFNLELLAKHNKKHH